MLTNIFLHDIQLPNGANSLSPRVHVFVGEILPKLEMILLDCDSSVINISLLFCIDSTFKNALCEFIKGECGYYGD